MDLNIDPLQALLEPPKEVTADYVRDLTPEDIPLIKDQLPHNPRGPNALKRLSLRHHRLAKDLAKGTTPALAAATNGYAVTTVYVLTQDPAFLELVEHYRMAIEEEFVDMGRRLADLGEDAVALLHQKLEENPEDLTVGQLNEIIKTTADRTGYGPATSTTNVNLNMNMAERLRQARERVGKTIEHEAE